jgi:hypothetical protein
MSHTIYTLFTETQYLQAKELLTQVPTKDLDRIGLCLPAFGDKLNYTAPLSASSEYITGGFNFSLQGSAIATDLCFALTALLASKISSIRHPQNLPLICWDGEEWYAVSKTQLHGAPTLFLCSNEYFPLTSTASGLEIACAKRYLNTVLRALPSSTCRSVSEDIYSYC